MELKLHRIRTADGAELAVRECGRGEPVIALHGIPEDHTSFRRLIGPLAHRVRWILPDLRGFGDSLPAARAPAVAPASLAEDVRTVAAALGLADPILLGHDLGGYAAIDFVQRGLGSARALILLNTTYKKVILGGSPQMALLCLPGLGRALVHLLGPRLADIAFGLGFAYASGVEPAHLEHCRRLCETARTHRAMADVWAAFGRAAAAKRWSRWRNRDLAKTKASGGYGVGPAPLPMEIPGLLVWGEEDVFLDARLRDWLGSLFPRMHLVSLPGTGHFPHQERPDETLRAIEDCLDRLGC